VAELGEELMINPSLRPYPIVRRHTVAPILFWAVQIIFVVLPLIVFRITGDMTVLGAALLGWIGATLAVGVGALIHGRLRMDLPAVFRVQVADGSEPGIAPDGYQDFCGDFAFKMLEDGRVQVLTERGAKIFRDWPSFLQVAKNY
jgi:hypothetical protein